MTKRNPAFMRNKMWFVCPSKIRYSRYQEAVQAEREGRKSRIEGGSFPLHVYHCTSCGGFHIGGWRIASVSIPQRVILRRWLDRVIHGKTGAPITFGMADWCISLYDEHRIIWDREEFER